MADVAGIDARVGRVPWEAEFHDGSLGNPITGAFGGSRPWLCRRLRVRIERWIVGFADRIVVVSQSTAELSRRRHPGRLADTLGTATGNARRVRATRTASPPSARDDK